jgi:hypothetical protein
MIMPHADRQRILEELSRLDRFRRGQLSEQYYERVNTRGQKVRQGPYYVWQGWVRGQKRSVRIAPDQVAQVRADLQAFAHFKELCAQLADITEQSTMTVGGDAKKKSKKPTPRSAAK